METARAVVAYKGNKSRGFANSLSVLNKLRF